MSNDTGVLTLADFLLARIAEDEAVAGAVSNRQREDWRMTANTAAGVAGHDAGLFILFHDPARVLAECEAKRQIMAEHVIGSFAEYNPLAGKDVRVAECETCGPCGMGGCLTLRALALPYADHADYRDEWRP